MDEQPVANFSGFDYRMAVRAVTNLLLLPVIVSGLATPGVVRSGWQAAVVFAGVAVLVNTALVVRFRDLNHGAAAAIAILGGAAISASALALASPATAQACLGLLAIVTTNAAITFPARTVALCVAACLSVGTTVIVLRAPSVADGAVASWIFSLILVVPTATVVRLRHQLSGAVDAAEERASVDALTGLLNRRGLRDGFANTLRTQAQVAVLLIDVDHFKSFNDRYGHAEGDELLRVLAEAIRAAAPPTALVARIGGEEFVVVLPTSLEHAESEAEKIRHTVASMARHERVTVSIGAASSAIEHADQAVLDRLIELADHTMYRAKAAGRNTVVAAHDRGGRGSPEKAQLSQSSWRTKSPPL